MCLKISEKEVVKMEGGQLFQKYYKAVAKEGINRAFVWGLMIGTIVFSVSAFVFWLFGYDFGLLISVFSGIAVTAAASVILYFRLFRPTSEAIARRLDEELNLEERMITMLELSKDESYIALCQREDAKKRLNSIKNAKIPRRISRLSVGLASGFSGLAVVIAGVFILSILDFLPRGLEILNPEEIIYVNIHYLENDGGVIQGNTEQRVQKGEDGEAVLAVASDGYIFLGWSDGVQTVARQDKNVTEELFVFPLFEEMEFGDGDSEGEGSEPGDQEAPSDAPPSENGTPDDDPGEPSPPSPGAGGSESESGNIVDGKTNYSDIYDYYYQLALQMLASGEELPEELRAFLESYYGSLL